MPHYVDSVVLALSVLQQFR